MIAVGLGAACAPGFPAYCAFRFLSGMAMTGIIVASLCLSEYTCAALALPTAVPPGSGGEAPVNLPGPQFPHL